jgi:hypothetical protein
MRLFSSRRESTTANLRPRGAVRAACGRAPSQREFAQLGQVLNLATRKEGMLDTVDLRAGWALVRLLGRRERNAKGAREFVLRRS